MSQPSQWEQGTVVMHSCPQGTVRVGPEAPRLRRPEGAATSVCPASRKACRCLLSGTFRLQHPSRHQIPRTWGCQDPSQPSRWAIESQHWSLLDTCPGLVSQGEGRARAPPWGASFVLRGSDYKPQQHPGSPWSAWEQPECSHPPQWGAGEPLGAVPAPPPPSARLGGGGC